MDSHPPFNLQEWQEDERVCVKVIGEVDLLTAPKLAARLHELASDTRRVWLDLSAVRFMDSTGLHVLIVATTDSRRDGWELTIGHDVSPQVRRLFQAAGIESLLLTNSAPTE